VRLQQGFDLLSDLCRVALEVLGPLSRDAVELELSVLQRDVRIQTGTGRCDVIAGHVLQLRVRMLLAPAVEED